MAQFDQPASVHYPPALADVIGYLEVPDKPGLKGGALLILRDEHGTVVTLRLLSKAADILLKVLQAGPTAALD